MATEEEHGSMVKYQFEIDDDQWEAWKATVPRSKSLETRIQELIKADADGRVLTENDEADSNSSLNQEASESTESEPATEQSWVPEDNGETTLKDDVAAYIEDRPPRTEHAKAAVLEIFSLLRENETMKTGELKDALWSDYGQHYNSKKAMWESVGRYLEDVPGIEKAGYGKWGYSDDEQAREELQENND